MERGYEKMVAKRLKKLIMFVALVGVGTFGVVDPDPIGAKMDGKTETVSGSVDLATVVDPDPIGTPQKS